eukprot:964587-Amphidinium_carterae.1
MDFDRLRKFLRTHFSTLSIQLMMEQNYKMRCSLMGKPASLVLNRVLHDPMLVQTRRSVNRHRRIRLESEQSCKATFNASEIQTIVLVWRCTVFISCSAFYTNKRGE